CPLGASSSGMACRRRVPRAKRAPPLPRLGSKDSSGCINDRRRVVCAAALSGVRDAPRPEPRDGHRRRWHTAYLGLFPLRRGMRPLIVTADPALQKVVRFHDLHDDRFAVETVFDIEDIVNENTAVRNSQPDGWKGREHLVASIPMPIYQALREAWRVLGLSTA